MLERHRAKKAAKRIRREMAMAKRMHVMATREWAILTIGERVVCRLSEDDINQLLDFMSDKNEIRQGIVGEVFE